MMEQFLEKKTTRIRRQLEKVIVQKLKTVYRKNNLITHIEIGKNFDFNLYQDEVYSSRELLTLYRNLGISEFTKLIGAKGEKQLIKLLKLSSLSELTNILEDDIDNEQIHLYKKLNSADYLRENVRFLYLHYIGQLLKFLVRIYHL